VAGTQKANGAVNSSFQVVSSEPVFKFNQLANEKFFADGDVFRKFGTKLGNAAITLADYEYPELTVAVNGATQGIKAMTAAAYLCWYQVIAGWTWCPLRSRRCWHCRYRQ
jgi:hypothetical protein